MKIQPTICGGNNAFIPESGCDDCEAVVERVDELEQRMTDSEECCSNNADKIEEVSGTVSIMNNTVSNLREQVESNTQQVADLTTALANKVDKVEGKGLSSNDFTAADKQKLDSVESGAQKNQNAFTKVLIGDVEVAADSAEDVLTLKAGTNITITGDADSDEVEISATNTSYGLSVENGVLSLVAGGTSSSVDVFTADNIIAGDNITVTEEDGNVTIAASRNILLVPIPEVQIDEYTYNGEEQGPTIVGDTEFLIITGEKGTNAGDYTLTLTLRNNVSFMWEDDTQAPKTYNWSIGKATPVITTSKDSVTLNADVSSDTVTVSATGGGTISVQSNDESVASATLQGDTVTINAMSDKSGKTTVTVSTTETANYAKGSKNIAVKLAFGAIYGAEWDGTATTKWSRTDEAADFTDPVAAVANGTGSSPFDEIAPWSEMTVVEDEEAGTLVKIPKFWYKWTRNGDAMKLQISTAEEEGFFVSPAHADRGDGKGERDIVYVGRYHCGSDHKSTTGVEPLQNETRSAARANISALGDDIWQYDYAMYWTICMLYLVEYADWNSQAVIGYGCGESASINTGSTDAMQYHTGTDAETRETYGNVQYRHIEGLWSAFYDWCDGIRFSGADVYAIKNPAEFSDSEGGVNVGARSTSSNYIKSFTNPAQDGYEYAIYPNAGGATGTTYVCDYCGYGASGVVLRVGGYYNYQNQNRGLFYMYGYDSAAGRGGSIGSRLQKLPDGGEA